MFSFNSSDRRYSRQRSSRNSFSSKISVSSAITSTSGASSGSNSTVTGETFTRRRARTSTSRSNPSPKQQRTRSQSSADSQESPAPTDSKRAIPSVQSDGPAVNVFQFLDPWESQTASRLSLNERTDEESMSEEHPQVPGDTGSHNDPLGDGTDSEEDGITNGGSLEGDTLRSFHSDSGISIKDDTPDQSPVATGPGSIVSGAISKESLVNAVLPEEPEPSEHRMQPSSISIEDAESFYRSMAGPSQFPHLNPSHHSRESRNKYGKSSGRERQATSHAPRSPSQYRTFDRLNRRALQSLQDELSSLELALEKLDISASSDPNPDSLDSTRTQIRRQALLDQIQLKLEKYNRLLASFQQVRRAFPSTSNPKRSDDRVSLLAPPRSHDPNPSASASVLQTTCIFCTLAIVFPLLAFSVVPSFFGRLTLLLGIVTGGWFGLGSQSVHDLIGEREAKVCFLGYLGAMVGAALLVS